MREHENAAPGIQPVAARKLVPAPPILHEDSLPVTATRTYYDGPHHVSFWVAQLVNAALVDRALVTGGDDARG